MNSFLCIFISSVVIYSVKFLVIRTLKKHMQEEEVRVFLLEYQLQFFGPIAYEPLCDVLAPWTFDPKQMLKCIKKLKDEVSLLF